MGLKDALKGRLTEKELGLFRGGFDTVGDIAILEVDESLKKKEKLIANKLLETNKHIKTILKEEGAIEGRFRLQRYKYLAGEKKTETIHKESNVAVKLDLRKAYFSSRLSHERLRISKLIKKNEDVLVMFSGVGIYPLVFSKNSKAKEIYGVEINKDACRYADENLKLNKIKNVKLFCGDVRKVLLKKKFDRIVMPLPFEADTFLDLAKKLVKKNGIIHLYLFFKDDEFDKLKDVIKNYIKNFKILRIVKCGSYAARMSRICVDVKVL